MSKNLVLVESPSKAKTINKYLGSTYKVEATVGHIRNLPKTKLGVDIDNNFEPQLLNIRGKGDVIKKIRTLSKKSGKIFIATDPDREGEAIAQDIVDVIEKHTKAKIYRVLFHEITKSSVKAAMKTPIEINNYVVSSQRARRVMDRIIGYKLSPFLWQAIIEESGNSLSAGRVQSVALRLICEREEEIDAFIKIEYWSVLADFKTQKGEILSTKLHSFENRTLKIQPKPEMEETDWIEFNKKHFAITNTKSASEIVKNIKSVSGFEISDIAKKESKRNPNPPFITSTLQAEASRRLKYRPRKTMQVAQSLYEGVDLAEEGFVGLITYMRTDSTRLNSEIIDDARNYIENIYGLSFKPPTPNTYEKKKGKIQDAHEAIRPTSVKYTPQMVKPYLNNEQFKLYNLIWNRFIACQMESAVLETTSVNVSGGEFIFKASGTAIKFQGFLKIYQDLKDEKDSEENENPVIPVGLEAKQNLDLESVNNKQHFTKPPARYSESTLIKALEENGIGRPSTYASIVGTIQDRMYVYQKERKFAPTDLGKKVNKVLIQNFSGLFNINYTAEMEEELDLIASGEKVYNEVIKNFYNPFVKNLEEVEKTIEKPKCEKCGSDMEIKIGRFGKFLACSNYPDCKNIQSLNVVKKEKEEPEYTGDKCPKCNSRLIFRNSRYGKFIGCEKYPDCDYTKQITLDIKCPACKEGDIVTRRTKKGRTFFGCSRYPECDFSSWTLPKTDENSSSE